MFSLIRAWMNAWVKNREAGDLRRNRAHNDVIVIDGLLIQGAQGISCHGIDLIPTDYSMFTTRANVTPSAPTVIYNV